MAQYKHSSTKTYVHEVGLSACFRQWRAKSHCRFLHGYALQVKLVFDAYSLDENNWVVDFGGLKPIKAWLEDNFDHKLLIARDDPLWEEAEKLHNLGLADVKYVDHVGCEAFAQMIYQYVDKWLITEYKNGKHAAVLRSVEVREHGGNSAIYERVD